MLEHVYAQLGAQGYAWYTEAIPLQCIATVLQVYCYNCHASRCKAATAAVAVAAVVLHADNLHHVVSLEQLSLQHFVLRQKASSLYRPLA
jgi:hypothetical protein